MFQGIRQFFAFAEEMIEISTENVKRIVIWLKPELLSRMDGWLETANCKNRSEFISKALRFYMGYLATDDVSSYVFESVSQNIRGMLVSLVMLISAAPTARANHSARMLRAVIRSTVLIIQVQMGASMSLRLP